MSAPLRHTTLVLTQEPRIVGKRSEKVPPHVTVLPWMDLSGIRPDFMTTARRLCAEAGRLVLRPAGDIIVGGEGHEKPAQAIDCPELVELHKQLFASAVDLGIEFSHPMYLGDGYNPHLTGGTTEVDLHITRLTVIDNHEIEGRERGMKTVTESIVLGDRS